MSVNYNPTAPEVLHFLGFQGALNTVEKFQVFEKEHGILLPPRLWDFLDVAAGNPLLGGTELWMDPRWYCTLYEELSTQLDSDSEDWEAAISGERAEAGFYGYSRIPREKWPETLPDRLLIGSDDCGIVTYGIRLDALAEDDPEVAWNRESGPLTCWQADWRLSEFLLGLVCDALLGRPAELAEELLQGAGWRFRWLRADAGLHELGIDPDRLHAFRSPYLDFDGSRVLLSCCIADGELCLLETSGEVQTMLVISNGQPGGVPA